MNSTDNINVIKEQNKEALVKLFTIKFVQAINESESSDHIREKLNNNILITN